MYMHMFSIYLFIDLWAMYFLCGTQSGVLGVSEP